MGNNKLKLRKEPLSATSIFLNQGSEETARRTTSLLGRRGGGGHRPWEGGAGGPRKTEKTVPSSSEHSLWEKRWKRRRSAVDAGKTVEKGKRLKKQVRRRARRAHPIKKRSLSWSVRKPNSREEQKPTRNRGRLSCSLGSLKDKWGEKKGFAPLREGG